MFSEHVSDNCDAGCRIDNRTPAVRDADAKLCEPGKAKPDDVAGVGDRVVGAQLLHREHSDIL